MVANRIWALVLVAMAAATGVSQGQPRSLFADQKAANIGDALTVIIQENASATNSTETTTEKSNALNIGSNIPQGGGNLMDFVPLHSLQSDAGNEFEGRAKTSRKAQLSARMTVTVVGMKVNGDLLVEVVRTMKINGETEAIHLSGSVNPAMVRRDNTILSSSIGDLHIEYTGKGTITQGARPGLLVRFVNWIF